ncbi:hypothetical protein V6N13_055428 [Hibiscus sabdariffa]|uniref:Uncharacterized protein n=2 Tax=Hibiscus sabdariffa TaxID=183260 RepID=A0ABR2NTP8_9ROSI
MVIFRPSFSLIFCCFLLASIIIFPQGIVSQRKLGPPPYYVRKPGSPGAPGSLAKGTSQTSSQVNSASATAKLEKQEEAP